MLRQPFQRLCCACFYLTKQGIKRNILGLHQGGADLARILSEQPIAVACKFIENVVLG